MHGVHHRHAGEAPGQARHHTSAGTVRVQEVRLALAHPATGAPLVIEAAPGPQWARWLPAGWRPAQQRGW